MDIFCLVNASPRSFKRRFQYKIMIKRKFWVDYLHKSYAVLFPSTEKKHKSPVYNIDLSNNISTRLDFSAGTSRPVFKAKNALTVLKSTHLQWNFFVNFICIISNFLNPIEKIVLLHYNAVCIFEM